MNYEELVKTRTESESYNYFAYGDNYYISRNDAIMSRSKKVYIEGIGLSSNPFASNHKMPSGHFKKIVDQKVLYSLSKGIYFNDKNTKKVIDEYFESGIDEAIIDFGLEASKKGECWVYGYKDNGKLKFTMIPSEQLTPIFDEYNKLILMIRRYDTLDFNYMNVFDDNTITVYKKKKSEVKYKLESIGGHWNTYSKYNGKDVEAPEPHGFGVVPFFPLWNNREHKSDLYPIKPLIDVYDIINSDFANNIDDMQDAFFTLKGFTGNTEELGKFVQQLKMYKTVPIGEDGEFQSHQLQIPTEARTTFLTRLEKDIYKFAMAVDTSNTQGGSITNVYIKALHSDLDLKCDQFESEVRKFIYSLIDFINANDSKNLKKKISFERNTIINKQESIDSLIKLSSILSQQTIMELLPYDIDYKQEQKRLEDEMSEIKLESTLTDDTSKANEGNEE